MVMAKAIIILIWTALHSAFFTLEFMPGLDIQGKIKNNMSVNSVKPSHKQGYFVFLIAL